MSSQPTVVAVTELEYRKAESVFRNAKGLECVSVPVAEPELAAAIHPHGVPACYPSGPSLLIASSRQHLRLESSNHAVAPFALATMRRAFQRSAKLPNSTPMPTDTAPATPIRFP